MQDRRRVGQRRSPEPELGGAGHRLLARVPAAMGAAAMLAPVPVTIRTSVRIYSSPRGRPRFRRATDVVLVVAAAVGLGLLIAAYPPPSSSARSRPSSRASPAGSIPSGRSHDLLWLWAIVARGRGRRLAATVDRARGIGAPVLAIVVAFIATRIAAGDWPPLGARSPWRLRHSRLPGFRNRRGGSRRVTVAPHLVRPLQTAGRWVIVLGVAGALFAEPDHTGRDARRPACGGRGGGGRAARALAPRPAGPGLATVAAALRELGSSAGDGGPARQVAGVFALVEGSTRAAASWS